MPRDSYQYIAFISYRHEAVGRKWAMWLQNAIESYRVPWALVKLGKAPRRVGKCFRDEEELAASSDLSKEIDAALEASKFLIVVCTPRTPHSRWVNEEIKRFRELGRGDQILALLVEGDPRESFPPALMEIRPSATSGDLPSDVPLQQIEPLAADIREDVNAAGGHGRGHMRSMAKLRIVAGMLGVSFDDLYNRNSRRVYGRMLVTAGMALLVAAVMIGLAAYAFAQRAEAQAQRQRAEKERDTAKFVSDFLLEDVLAGASPDKIPEPAIREAIVTRMIDPAAERAGEKLRDRPEVEREVHDRLGRAYETIGYDGQALTQFRKAMDLAEKTLPEDDPNRNNIANNFAKQLWFAGRSDEAEPIFRKVLSVSRRVLGDDHLDTIRSITNLGDVLCRMRKLTDAEPLCREGYERARKTLGEENEETTFAANTYARLLWETGQLRESERLLRGVYDVRRRKFGADDTRTLSAAHNLAAVLLDLDELADAELRCREALSGRLRILTTTHRDTLTTLNQYARIIAGMGAIVEAERLAVFIVSQSLEARSPKTKEFAKYRAQWLDQLGRTAEAQKVRREFAIETPPPSTQPASAARPLEGDAARFVQQLLTDLKTSPTTNPAAGG